MVGGDDNCNDEDDWLLESLLMMMMTHAQMLFKMMMMMLSRDYNTDDDICQPSINNLGSSPNTVQESLHTASTLDAQSKLAPGALPEVF